MKILIADDEKYVRLELLSLLSELIPFAEIDEVENGTGFKKALLEREYNIAFIDIKMPGPSSLDILSDIKKWHTKTVFIILSGYSDFEYARKAITLGVSEYMLKPVSKKQLYAVLKKLVPAIQIHLEDESIANNLIHDAEKVIYKRYKEQIGVSQIADDLNVSPNYLSSQFKKYKKQTLTSYITDLRLKTAIEMLQLPGANVKTISENLGYQSSRHFARLFRDKYGKSPSDFIKESRI
ncbi:MAG: helix-turn-helix domain-containing protein [Spirochaetaceae bacterium]|jgi:two-component system response regulator YesN|nr:helix-turn-helix domain-containing protein [Spirochaetaceae bacterium]